MAVDEQKRHQLFVRLEEVLGADETATLMSGVPPGGWIELATKADIQLVRDDVRGEMRQLGERIDLRIEALEHRLAATFRAELTAAITSQTRSLILTVAALAITLSGMAFAADRLSP